MDGLTHETAVRILQQTGRNVRLLVARLPFNPDQGQMDNDDNPDHHEGQHNGSHDDLMDDNHDDGLQQDGQAEPELPEEVRKQGLINIPYFMS